MKLYILIGNMVIRIEKEERSVDLDRKEPRMRHYETMQQLVDWIQREERSVDLDRKEPRMRHYETINQLVDYIERKERMRHYETIKQVFGLNPREERETKNERANQRFFIDLDPIGEMFIDLDPIGEMLVYLDPIGEMVFGLNPREEMVFGLNPREEMLVYLDPIGEMVFGSNPREERETKNERAIQRFLVDLDSIGEMLVDWIQREERMRHYETMQQLVYLDPIGEMVFGLNPREERVFGLNPREERETKIEKAIQRFVFGLNPREERETKNEKAIQRFLVRLDSIGEMERYFSFFRETKNEGANQRFLVYLDPIGEMMEYYNIQLMKHYEAEQKLVNLNQRGEIAILNADTLGHCWGKLEVHFSNRRSWHGTKLLKSSLSLAPFFLPSAGGTGHGSGQPEHQGHSEIYPSTLNVVSNCPSRGEYMQTSLTKCAEVCGSYMQDGNCAYHCMRDSSKTKLVEFCAKPKPFFDYCPEYDPVDQTIQKDFATLCNSTSTRNYYDSSDIYFCDPNNCLQLHESSVRNGATTLTTLMNETTEMNDGDSQGWILPLFIVLAALLAVIIIGYILFRVFGKRGIFSEMRRNRNQNGKQYVYTRKRIPDYV